jgi:hypothetical protein
LMVRGGRGRVPLYYEGKVLFVLWLWHPKTRGAAYLYQHTVQATPLPRRPPGCLGPAGVAHLLSACSTPRGASAASCSEVRSNGTWCHCCSRALHDSLAPGHHPSAPAARAALTLWARCAQPLLSKHEATIDRHLSELRTTVADFASTYFNRRGGVSLASVGVLRLHARLRAAARSSSPCIGNYCCGLPQPERRSLAGRDAMPASAVSACHAKAGSASAGWPIRCERLPLRAGW